jgi:predicted secreted protein
MKSIFLALTGSIWLACSGFAYAGPSVNIQANARSSLPNDEMLVQFAVERSGTDIGSLNDQVLAQLNEALAQAKQVRGVVSRLGNVYTHQQYNAQGKVQGWTVRGELQLEGRDMKATGELAGKLAQKLQLSGVSFRLSESKRAQEEQRLLKEAAQNYSQRAREVAAAFGFASYEFKQMTIQQSGAVVQPRPMAAMARSAMAEAVPTEGGDSTVTVGVSGSIELK